MKKFILPLILLALVGCKHKATVEERIQSMITDRKVQLCRDTLELEDDIEAILATDPYSHRRNEAIDEFEDKYYDYLDGTTITERREEYGLLIAKFRIKAAMIRKAASDMRREEKIIASSAEE